MSFTHVKIYFDRQYPVLLNADNITLNMNRVRDSLSVAHFGENFKFPGKMITAITIQLINDNFNSKKVKIFDNLRQKHFFNDCVVTKIQLGYAFNINRTIFIPTQTIDNLYIHLISSDMKFEDFQKHPNQPVTRNRVRVIATLELS